MVGHPPSEVLHLLVRCILGGEGLHELDDGGAQDHDEQGWKDHEDQREGELDTGLARGLLGPLAALGAHGLGVRAERLRDAG